jgi:hypothetical protein
MTSKEQMFNTLWMLAKRTHGFPRPFSPPHIISRRNSIPKNLPNENLNFWIIFTFQISLLFGPKISLSKYSYTDFVEKIGLLVNPPGHHIIIHSQT